MKTLLTNASVAAGASINLPHGIAPTSPINGDLWTDAAGVYARLGGVTTVLAAIGGVVTSVSGTANRITSTGGATPAIDISAAYVGQTSITTLGTVTAGTWNATAIAGTKGGTGLTATAQYSLLIGNTGTTWTTLAKVASSVLATDASGVVAWNTPGNLKMLYTSSTGILTALTLGTSGQVLIGGSTAPSFTGSPSITALTLSSLTDGRVPYAGAAGLLSDSANLQWINASSALSLKGTGTFYGRLGQALDINVSANYGGMALNTWSAIAVQAPLLDFNRSKSATVGTITQVTTNDALGYIYFNGYDVTTLQTGATIEAAAEELFAGSAGSRLVFKTTTIATTTTVERMRIDSSGRVGIGMTPARTLDVTGTFGATGAATLGSTLGVAGISTLGVVNAGATTVTTLAGTGALSGFTTGTFADFLDITSTGSNYNEGIRIHAAPDGYALIALGATAGTTGTGVGQWSLYRNPGAGYSLLLDYNVTNILTITTAGAATLAAGITATTATLSSDLRFNGTNYRASSNAALLGSTCPSTGVNLTAPYTWIRVLADDGTPCVIPGWKI